MGNLKKNKFLKYEKQIKLYLVKYKNDLFGKSENIINKGSSTTNKKKI